MTYLEIDKAITDILVQMRDECKARLDAVSKDNLTEQKALHLEYGMYQFCGNAGLLHYKETEKKFRIRQNFLSRVIPKYPKLNLVYSELSEDDKIKFIAAIQAELFIRDQWLHNQYKDLTQAEASGDSKAVFELKIKIGAVERVFSAWERWRKENNIYQNMFLGGSK
ncbi:MAG: hypothetical protein IJV70_01955 [Clostridia bacterium]|nr:hypothetical protein [Clostridia bacterium]